MFELLLGTVIKKMVLVWLREECIRTDAFSQVAEGACPPPR